mgnify:CR=1 FL=1
MPNASHLFFSSQPPLFTRAVYDYYLKTKVIGTPLVNYINNPKLVIKLIKEAFDIIHNVDISNIKILNKDSVGNKLVHGDFCLPNILASDKDFEMVVITLKELNKITKISNNKFIVGSGVLTSKFAFELAKQGYTKQEFL